MDLFVAIDKGKLPDIKLVEKSALDIYKLKKDQDVKDNQEKINKLKDQACNFQKEKLVVNTEFFNKFYDEHKLAVGTYPRPAILVQVHFVLESPYISQDDCDFYFMDNPLAKDRIFKIPVIRGTGWKGMLRHACFQNLWSKIGVDLLDLANYIKNATDEQVINIHRLKMLNLFGIDNDNMDLIWSGIYNDLQLDNTPFHDLKKNRMNPNQEGLKGRLHFYTSFLGVDTGAQIDYILINPHDRTTKFTKHGPILIESISEGAKGKMEILYFPYDLVCKVGQSEVEVSENKIKEELIADMELVLDGIRDLFCEYGISAKSKSGYGKCKIEKVVIESNVFANMPLSKKYSFDIEWRLKDVGE